MLGTDILLFDGELTMGDIEKYEAAKMQTIVSKIQYAENFTGELKSWVFEHPDVKIIRRSRYNSLSTAQQEKHEQAGTLVLKGEVLTLKDVQYYETQH